MKNFQKYVNDHTWICMYGMLLEGLEPSYLDETPMLFIKLQERWGGVWVGGWRYFDGDNLGGADGTFACKRTLWSFKVWWDSFSLLSEDLVHFGRKLVDHLGEDIWISCSDGFCNSTHHSINAFGSRISIDLMRHDSPPFLNTPPKLSPFACKCVICSS